MAAEIPNVVHPMLFIGAYKEFDAMMRGYVQFFQGPEHIQHPKCRAFVVIRSMRSQKEEEPEEELSVETLLQSTPEEELEDLELEGKSEERLLIEKFVDENPEAVANLLRNWLTEEW